MVMGLFGQRLWLDSVGHIKHTEVNFSNVRSPFVHRGGGGRLREVSRLSITAAALEMTIVTVFACWCAARWRSVACLVVASHGGPPVSSFTVLEPNPCLLCSSAIVPGFETKHLPRPQINSVELWLTASGRSQRVATKGPGLKAVAPTRGKIRAGIIVEQ